MALFGKKKEETSPGAPPPMEAPLEPAPEQYPPESGQDYGQPPPEAYPQEQYPPGTPGQLPPGAPPPMGAPPPPAPEIGKEQIEEIAEAIVDEKWKEKEIEINKIIEWKDETVTKLTQFKQQIDDLKASFDSLHKGMLGKISEYDENLTNVGTEIKAMEKVFSKVLPSLTDSVNKMQRMTGTVKKK